MALTHIIRPDCPTCGKPAREKEHFVAILPKPVNGMMKPQRTKITILECGHTIQEEKLEVVEYINTRNVDETKQLFPFQAETCRKVVKANFRAILRLDMGLGKTIISATLLRQHWKNLAPILIVCKASMTEQWLMELLEWCPQKLFQVLETSRDKPTPGVKAYIVSKNLMAPRYSKKDRIEKGGLPWLKTYGFKTIIFDEIQHIKNPDAAMTRFIQDLVATEQCKFFLAPSGTPIKNNVGEYFNILNIVDPIHFRYRQQFYDTYINYYYTESGYMKAGGLKQNRYEEFRKITDPYIIDYTREEVMPQLPRVFRQRHFFQMDADTDKAYNKSLGEFLDAYDGDNYENAFQRQAAIGQSLMKMYHLVGFSKVDPIVDFVGEWLEQHDEEKDLLAFDSIGSTNGSTNGKKEVKLRAKPKIIVFIHHIDVGTVIQYRLDEILKASGDEPCSRLLGGISGSESSTIEREFRDNPKRRVLIASTLAAGEGKNFQFCQDAVMGERQWNPPNEAQAEARFPRPGSTASQVNIMYPVAVGTMDEYMAELVEKKRSFIETTKGKFESYIESEFMKELVDTLATKGRAKWRLTS